METSKLTKGSVNQLFFRYLIPSICGTMVTSIYILADTIIIGKGIGIDAMAALNIVLPLFSVFFGQGMLFGVGGAVLMSVARGSGDASGNRYFSAALLMNTVFSLMVTLICFLFFEPISWMMGATDITMPYIREYAPYVIGGSIFFAFSTFLQTFVRNDGAPKLAMAAVISGGVLNIILDIVFVFLLGMGMSGAAIASVLGSVCTDAILCFHFRSENNALHFSLQGCGLHTGVQIIKNGFTSFILELTSGITIFIFNLQILKYIGDTGVSVYGILTNTAIIVTCLCNGVSQASQPLISVNYGAGHTNRVNRIRKTGMLTGFLLCAVVGALGLIFPRFFVNIFVTPNEAILALAPDAIGIYFTSFFVIGVNMFIISYFQSTLRPGASLLLSVGRGCVFSAVYVYLLPIAMGVNGIWAAMPLAEASALIMAGILLRKNKNRNIEQYG